MVNVVAYALVHKVCTYHTVHHGEERVHGAANLAHQALDQLVGQRQGLGDGLVGAVGQRGELLGSAGDRAAVEYGLREGRRQWVERGGHGEVVAARGAVGHLDGCTVFQRVPLCQLSRKYKPQISAHIWYSISGSLLGHT